MRTFVTAAILTLGISFAYAQDEVDPPTRAARLGYLSGSVSFQPGGVEDWIAAAPNRPMTTGDRLWTDDASRAEMNLGSAVFRLGARTNFTFLNLDDQIAQVQVSIGVLNVRLRRLNDNETVEIDTPQAAFVLLRPGEYRIEVSDGGDATIATVRGGDMEATANGQAIPVHAREQVRIFGPEGANPIVDRRFMPPADAFDLFCQDRDRREDISVSARYVSRDMPGYADLDANGVWRQDPAYGAVWVPTAVVDGWSPYHYGHWSWIDPWGWTWVDDAPWGYAPFHYGRWAMVGGGWGWIPGPIAVRPVYAPAMVAFVGGAGFSAAISIGGGAAVGWFPLGPREVWVPSYHVSAAYLTRVNVSNTVVTEVAVRNVYTNVYINKTTVVNNVYVNQRVPGAVVAVRGDVMTGGRPVAAAAIRVSPSAVASVAVVHAAAVAPERGAVLGGRAPSAAVRMPPAAVMNRTIVANAAPPPPPVPFARKQEALRADPGRPLAAAQVRTFQGSAPALRPNIRAAAPNAPAAKAASPAARPAIVNTPAPRPPAPTPEERVVRPTPQPRPTVEPRPAPAPTPEERVVRPTPQPRPTVEPRPAPAPTPEPRKVESRPEDRREPPKPNPERQPEKKTVNPNAKRTSKTEKPEK